jgi:hypothetical protein
MLNKDYLRLLLADRKQLMPIGKLRAINVPKFDELSVKNIFPMKAKDEKFMKYMPDRCPKGRLPDRRYFFNVLNTLYPESTQTIIENANRLRNSGVGSNTEGDTVVVTEEWWQKLHQMPFISGKIFCTLIPC